MIFGPRPCNRASAAKRSSRVEIVFPRQKFELELVGGDDIGKRHGFVSHEFRQARSHVEPGPASPITGSQQKSRAGISLAHGRDRAEDDGSGSGARQDTRRARRHSARSTPSFAMPSIRLETSAGSMTRPVKPPWPG